MQTYTVLLDYAGGTYVSQCTATDAWQALRTWVSGLHENEAAGAISEEVAEAFDGEMGRPVHIQGLKNAWCATASAKSGLAIANIIETVA